MCCEARSDSLDRAALVRPVTLAIQTSSQPASNKRPCLAGPLAPDALGLLLLPLAGMKRVRRRLRQILPSLPLLLFVAFLSFGVNLGGRLGGIVPASAATRMTTTLTTKLASPQVIGTQIVFSALASGGSGSYQYEFLQQFPGGQWAVVQSYSSNPSWTWNTSKSQVGVSYFEVLARSTGSKASYEASAWMCFTTYAAPATSVSFT